MAFGKLGAMGRGFGTFGAHGGLSNNLIRYAPAIDQPIITSGGGAASFPTMTLHQMKRIGDNTTAVDMDNDTKFRYLGMPTGVLVPDAVNTMVVSSLMPGGTAQARTWDTQIEMLTSSKFIAMSWTPTVSTPLVLIVVNGKWVSAAFNATATAGSGSFVMLEFPDNRARRVKFIASGGNKIFGFRTELAYPPTRPTGSATVAAMVGDSLSAGSGTPPTGATFLDVWPHAVANILGFDHCCNASIGGTKWVASGAGDVAVSHFGGGRITPLLTTNPTAIVFAGSRNDSNADQAALDAITSAVSAAMDAVSTVSKRFVMGTFTSLSQNAAVQAGAAAKSVPFVDMTYGLQAADLGGDSIHPTYQGAINLRTRIVPALRAAGCVP
ncbi:hypothetical protein ABIF96_005816 [Bradyrhizobium ottawaense]|uniref:SGNH/GDSL hydrolase family protein n=1 Tax=Bradyrhizobium ottawaense TaxID=931866 RepID=UPI0038377C1B